MGGELVLGLRQRAELYKLPFLVNVDFVLIAYIIAKGLLDFRADFEDVLIWYVHSSLFKY